MIELKKLIDAAVHFGHKTTYWNPRMEPYIWGHKNKIHLIDISKTAHQLDKAAEFLKSIAAQNKTIMWVGTKKASRDILKSIGIDLGLPYVTHRWIGGTLTNASQIKKSVTNLCHQEDILAKSEQFSYTKKELGRLQKTVNRLRENVGGIISIKWPIGALVVVDVRKEQAAVKEARTMGVPVVALVDTNSDPSLIDYVIPGNDDAPQSISIIMNYLAQAVKEGQQLAKTRHEEQIIAQAAEAVAEEALELKFAAEDEEESVAEKTDGKVTKVKKFKDAAPKPKAEAAPKKFEARKEKKK